MNTRSTYLTELAIKQTIAEQFAPWNSVSLDQISITRLAGLTNITYKAVVKCDLTPKTIVFREFGNAEGFVDSKQERIIFKSISDLELGPKQLECGDTWRMEEFVTQGVHPTNEKTGSADFQFKAMGVLQKFHQMDIPIPNEGSSLILQKTLSQQMKENVLKKIEKKELYTDIELNQLECIENFLNNDEEYKNLERIVQQENYEELKFCHNDLNQLNIFNTENKGREIVFIDYEYCSFNYPSYDIANFLNESAINYQHEEDPYYILVDDNFDTAPIQAKFLALSYIIQKECTNEEIEQINTFIGLKTNKDKDELKQFIVQIKSLLEQRMTEEQINELFQQVSYLKRRIRRLQIISNLNWVWWSVLLAHEKNSLNFEYIDYGLLRFKMFERLLELEKNRSQQ